MRLGLDFYRQGNVVEIARGMLGLVLCTRFSGGLTAGRIVETEAYRGQLDRACHAHGGRKTDRNAVMYEAGGVAYVYLCYGLHHLFNVVTNTEGEADAVLIRAVEPLRGEGCMARRRGRPAGDPHLTDGPGKVAQALGLTREHNGISLAGNRLWIEGDGFMIEPQRILSGPRIGVSYAGDDAKLPWRFTLKKNKS
ncbi:MAG: DNA-3-methyladenine glycosylase [Candidatus Methylacidiphilales bacterium]